MANLKESVVVAGSQQAVLWLSTLLLATILLVAAYGKMFYPTEELSRLDFWVSIFEIGLLANLILYRNHWAMWLFAAGIFACWGGYSLFWFQAELPCSCMGAYFDLPNGLSLAINGAFYVLSVGLARWIGAPSSWWYGSFVNASVLALGGFAFAQWIYQTVVV